MKNKKALYILIPAVVLVWGVIFYKIFTKVNNNQEFTQPVQTVAKPDTTQSEPLNYSIQANYRDPFLKEKVQIKEKNKEEEETKTKKSRNNRRRRVVQRTRWPDVRYQGVIKNRKNDRYVILIEINNKQHLFHQGDTIHEMCLEKFTKDTVHLKYQDDRRAFPRIDG